MFEVTVSILFRNIIELKVKISYISYVHYAIILIIKVSIWYFLPDSILSSWQKDGSVVSDLDCETWRCGKYLYG